MVGLLAPVVAMTNGIRITRRDDHRLGSPRTASIASTPAARPATRICWGRSARYLLCTGKFETRAESLGNRVVAGARMQNVEMTRKR